MSGDAEGEGRAKEFSSLFGVNVSSGESNTNSRPAPPAPDRQGNSDLGMFGAGFQKSQTDRLRSLARARHRSVGSSLGASACLELCQHVDAGID